MSQPEHRILNATDHDSEEANRRDPLQRAQNQGKEPEFSDSSSPLFVMYQRMTEEADNKRAEELKDITKGTIIFSALFSAVIAAFGAVTVLDLKPNSQDTSAFYVQNIYQHQMLIHPNISPPFVPSTVAQLPRSSLPAYVDSINSTLFSNLTIFIAHHDAQDLNNPIEMRSLPCKRQSDLLAENPSPSDNSVVSSWVILLKLLSPCHGRPPIIQAGVGIIGTAGAAGGVTGVGSVADIPQLPDAEISTDQRDFIVSSLTTTSSAQRPALQRLFGMLRICPPSPRMIVELLRPTRQMDPPIEIVDPLSYLA